jgi:glutamyl-tRNA reductase
VTHGRELVAVGLDHATAAVELRERMAFAAADIPSALVRLAGPRAGRSRACASSTPP